MRIQWIGGGALAAGLLLVLGLVFAGPGGAPGARAQAAECPDDAFCVLVSKEADPEDTDDEFDFSSDADEGDFSLGAGEAMPLTIAENGSITVTEDEMDDWALVDIDCDGADGVDIAIDEGSGSVSVDFSELEEDEFAAVSCAFFNTMEEEETATPTTSPSVTPTETETPDETATPSTTTTTSSSANTPVVPTPIPPTPRPPASEVQSGSISPPTTGSGGLK